MKQVESQGKVSHKKEDFGGLKIKNTLKISENKTNMSSKRWMAVPCE